MDTQCCVNAANDARESYKKEITKIVQILKTSKSQLDTDTIIALVKEISTSFVDLFDTKDTRTVVDKNPRIANFKFTPPPNFAFTPLP